MNPRGKNPSQSGPRKDQSGIEKKPAPPTAISGPIRWLFRVVLVLSPIILLVGLEGILRVTGYGYPTTFFLHQRVEGKKVLVNNNQFGWRFFGQEAAREPYPFMMAAEKPPGVIRVFVFGESAAYGDPQPDFGLPRILAALLRDRYPGVTFEVINTAMVAINSNVILQQARECAHQDGDIWVVYMGNNEVVGPFGSGTVFGPQAPGLGLIRANLALKATRTGELMGDALRRVSAGKSAPAEWRGLLMFIDHQVRADDPRMAIVYSHFEQNLRDILNAGRRAGAGIVVSTVASNLRDCAPFGSLHRAGLSAAELAGWNTNYDAGVALEQNSHPLEACELFRKAAAVDDSYADLQYQWANCCLALGREEEARQHFVAARDADTLRFRADTRINQIIRQSAQGRDTERILFADGQGAIAAASPHQLPGREFLYEHVHMTFEGNYLVARTIADQVARQLPESVTRHSDPRKDWLAKNDCARRLAFGDWARYRGYQALQVDVPPYTYQSDHAEEFKYVKERMEALSAALKPPELNTEIEECRRAVNESPDDWTLDRVLGQMEQQLGDLKAAEQAWTRIRELLPQDSQAWFQLGMIAQYQGRTDDAASLYASAMEIDPVYARASFVKLLNESAISQTEHGRFEPAVALFKQALGLNPNLPEVRINLGSTFIALGKTSDAQEQFRLALAHKPTTPSGLVLLGCACHSQGWHAEAVSCFEEALHLDRFDGMAHFYFAEDLSGSNRFADAQPHYVEAARLLPDSAVIQTGWSAALLAQGKVVDAIAHAQQAVKLDPKDDNARQQLDAALGKNH